MDANKLSNISIADTDEKVGGFLDSHDFTEFDNPDAPDIEFEITRAVIIEAELFTAIEKQTHERGIQVETLVNLWLQQKLAELKQTA